MMMLVYTKFMLFFGMLTTSAVALFVMVVTASMKNASPFDDPAISAYRQHIIDRWSKYYSVNLPNHVKIVGSPGSFIVTLKDYPEEGKIRAGHFEGSRLEASKNRAVIEGYIETLKETYGAELLSFKTLDEWTSQEFTQILADKGWISTETSTIMSIGKQVFPQNDFNRPEYELRLVSSLKDLKKIAQLHGSSIGFILERMPINGLQDGRVTLWAIFSVPDDECVCSGVFECFDGRTAGVHVVGTDERHRRKGLATTLMITAIGDAFRRWTGLERIVLASTPEAVGLYQHLGFRVHGSYQTYKHTTAVTAGPKVNRQLSINQ